MLWRTTSHGARKLSNSSHREESSACRSLNEFASVARRKILLSWSEVTEALDAFRVLCPFPLPITIEMHEAALKIAEKHGYNIYDALVVSAALEAECTTLYSEDLHDGQTIDGQLTIRNPFVGSSG